MVIVRGGTVPRATIHALPISRPDMHFLGSVEMSTYGADSTDCAQSQK